MNIDKAIEILHEDLHHLQDERSPDVNTAIKLGIEALTAIRAWRLDWAGNRFHALPGETDVPPLSAFTKMFDSAKH